MRFGALVVALALLGTTLAGCLSSDDNSALEAEDDGSVVTASGERRAPGAGANFDTTGSWSATLSTGVFDIDRVLDITIEVPLPATEGAAGAAGTATVHMGVFLPNVPAGEKVPVIADIGPYYSGDGPVTQLEGDNRATSPANRLGGFLIQNYVPHGYAVAQVSVFGTGESTHCMDLMGRSEQAGIDAAVTWLGTQDWSNGNVGLTGRSYDGSTPWEAAMTGNEHLKTIAPISGLIGLHELMWRNGSSELRGGSGVLWGLYFTFGFDGEPDDVYNALCADTLLGPAESVAAWATGDQVFPDINSYWAERYFLDAAIENYKGSVFLIHGLQDWNVDPHMAFPTHRELQKAGIEVRGLYGQWAHQYPDRPSEHQGLGSGRGGEAFPESVRYDWAQDMLEWFDYYLKEVGPKPALHAEVQDNQGQWRVEDTYPPSDLQWESFTLGTDLITQATQARVSPVDSVAFETSTFSEETRIAGLPQLHIDVIPNGPGGQIFARLDEVAADGSTLRLGHAIMDLRLYGGGKGSVAVVPAAQINAKMEFEAFDAVVHEGSKLRLTLAGSGEDYLPSVISTPVDIVLGEGSTLRLPIVEPAEEDFFTPPVWWTCTQHDPAPTEACAA